MIDTERRKKMSIELKQLIKNYATKNSQLKPWEQDW